MVMVLTATAAVNVVLMLLLWTTCRPRRGAPDRKKPTPLPSRG